jgi:quercetin dioxygenase-like cupin family protein
VEQTNLKDHVRFSPDTVRRETVFDTDRMWAEVLCFERSQRIGPVMDSDSDALFTVAAGQAVFQVGNERKRAGQWDTVLVPAGSEVTVTNASADPLVLFLVAAPPPVPRSVSG